jgi:hypothetical protein
LARLFERKAASDEIVTAAIKLHYAASDPPTWFLRIVSRCRVEAGTAANRAVHFDDAAFQRASGEAKRLAYHDAYTPAFAEAFPRLLARALAKRGPEA